MVATIDITTMPIEEVITLWNERKSKIEAHKTAIQDTVDEEFVLRVFIANALWPADKAESEGTQYKDLGNGWRLKGVVKIDRKIDEASLPAVVDAMTSKGVNCDDFIDRKPTLVVKKFKELTAEQQLLFSQALVVKPSAPTLEVVPPKEKK